MFIPILLGTAREGRQSEKIASFVLEQAQAYGAFDTELVDVRDFHLSRTDKTSEESKKWSAIMARADGLIVVAPEYNHSLPGELKMFLDQIYPEYERKPLGICSVSGGGFGGVNMTQHLRLVGIELKMVPIYASVPFSHAGDEIDASYTDRVKGFFDELVWYAQALKTARDGA